MAGQHSYHASHGRCLRRRRIFGHNFFSKRVVNTRYLKLSRRIHAHPAGSCVDKVTGRNYIRVNPVIVRRLKVAPGINLLSRLGYHHPVLVRLYGICHIRQRNRKGVTSFCICSYCHISVRVYHRLPQSFNRLRIFHLDNLYGGLHISLRIFFRNLDLRARSLVWALRIIRSVRIVRRIGIIRFIQRSAVHNNLIRIVLILRLCVVAVKRYFHACHSPLACILDMVPVRIIPYQISNADIFLVAQKSYIQNPHIVLGTDKLVLAAVSFRNTRLF